MLPPPPPAIIWQEPQSKPAAQSPLVVCDDSGVIRCAVTETVPGDRAREDVRLIATYIKLVSERNLRYYTTWHEKLPSAAYEVVRRIHQFPFLPRGDVYGIVEMQLILQPDLNRIVVRYPKRPGDATLSELAEDDYATYATDLAAFMKAIAKETARLKKYEKHQPQ